MISLGHSNTITDRQIEQGINDAGELDVLEKCVIIDAVLLVDVTRSHYFRGESRSF